MGARATARQTHPTRLFPPVDAALTSDRAVRGLLKTALAPVWPQIAGSAVNIFYNLAIVRPLLTKALDDRFTATVLGYNLIAYPIAVAAWLWIVYSLRPTYHALLGGGDNVSAA